MRSPETCACKNNEICPICYGHLSRVNKGTGIGSLAAAKTTEPVSQNILSTKHLLVTNSEEMTFNDDFEVFLKLLSNIIVVDPNIEYSLKRLALVIKREDIQKVNIQDSSEYNTFVTRFYIKETKKKIMYEINETTGKSMYLVPELLEVIHSLYKNHLDDTDTYEIPFNKLIESSTNDGDDEVLRLFILEINNKELTEPLYAIMGLLGSANKRTGTDIDSISQDLLDLLIEGHIDVPGVFGEILIKPMIRRATNKLEIPDWANYHDSDNYTVLVDKSALEKNPSVLISISSHSLKRQFKDMISFQKREVSFLDPLFRE